MAEPTVNAMSALEDAQLHEMRVRYLRYHRLQSDPAVL